MFKTINDLAAALRSGRKFKKGDYTLFYDNNKFNSFLIQHADEAPLPLNFDTFEMSGLEELPKHSYQWSELPEGTIVVDQTGAEMFFVKAQAGLLFLSPYMLPTGTFCDLVSTSPEVVELCEQKHYEYWAGDGDKPLPNGTLVCAVFRDGREYALPLFAEDLTWAHDGEVNDIIAYRIMGKGEDYV